VFITVSELCVLFLLFWGLFHWLGIFAKTRVLLALLGVLGIGGFLGRALVWAATWLQHVTGSITGWVFGTAVPAALFLVLAALLIHDMHPRNGATRRTGYLAFAVGAFLVAGVAGIPALSPVAGFLRSLLATLTTWLNSL
jgi:hypothetical protein